MNLSYMLVIPKGARNVAGAKRLLCAVLDPAPRIAFARDSLSFPMNASVALPAEVQRELGATTEEMMSGNYRPRLVGRRLRASPEDADDRGNPSGGR